MRLQIQDMDRWKDKWIAYCTALGQDPAEIQRITMYADGAVEIRTWDEYHALDTYQ